MITPTARISLDLLVLATLLTPTRALPQQPDSSAMVQSVLAFEDARFAAMVRADTAALGAFLAADLSYVHTSARTETKAQYLESVGAGRMKYQEFTPRRRRARLLGSSAAVVVGLAHAHAESNGQLVDIDVRYVGVYERVRERWQLVAWQTTRVP